VILQRLEKIKLDYTTIKSQLNSKKASIDQENNDSPSQLRSTIAAARHASDVASWSPLPQKWLCSSFLRAPFMDRPAAHFSGCVNGHRGWVKRQTPVMGADDLPRWLPGAKPSSCLIVIVRKRVFEDQNRLRLADQLDWLRHQRGGLIKQIKLRSGLTAA
jgi:hypothetical protein